VHVIFILKKITKRRLKGNISRADLYKQVPKRVLDRIINASISENNETIFAAIDSMSENAEIDLIIGGPPCQAYSYLGRAALKNKAETDERNFLYKGYGKFLLKYKPKMFVFENVPGLRTAGGGKHFKDLKQYFHNIGYELDCKSINAFDFGVVQNRERLVIIGWKKELKLSYPDFDTVNSIRTRDDIFTDLPPLAPGHTERISYYSSPANDYLLQTGLRTNKDFVSQHITRPHNNRDLAIYRMAIILLIEEGKRIKNNDIPETERTQKNIEDFTDRFKVVDIKPHTMIAHIAKDGHHFIHPDLTQLRSISVREAARIQSFPDDFYFEGCKESQYRSAAFKQIGNAVPPLMATSIGEKIKQLINGNTNKN